MNTDNDDRISIEEFIAVFTLANSTLHQNCQHCKDNIRDYEAKKAKALENMEKCKNDKYNQYNIMEGSTIDITVISA